MRAILPLLLSLFSLSKMQAQASLGQLSVVGKSIHEQAQFLGATSALMVLDTLEANHYTYQLDLEFWTRHLPQQANIKPSVLSIKALPNAQFAVTQDLDGDGSLHDEVVHILTQGDALSIQYPIFHGADQLLTYPFSLEIFSHYDGFHPSINPLFKYQIKQCVIPGIDSIFYHPSTLLPAVYVHSKQFPKLSKNYYLIDEPFQLGDAWYTIGSPDLWEGTVRVRRLTPEEKPLGYRPGYFANIDRLSEQVNAALGAPVMAAEASKRGYTLHHFWGPWCHPCMAETEAVQALEERLQHTNVQVIHHCYLFNQREGDAQKWQETLDQLIEVGKVHPQQVVTVLPDPKAADCYNNSTNQFEDGCNPIHLLNINRFPSYVLIAPDGRILYHNDSRILRGDPKFERLLSKILQPKKTNTTAVPTPTSPRG